MEGASVLMILLLHFLLVSMAMGTSIGTCGHLHGHHHPRRKLFVFGDSYADTGNLGNLGRSLTSAWYSPYGTTFPHRPTGRYSDGRILTDYFASFLGIKSPLPYKYRKTGLVSYGMNYAVGGTGVFDTENLQRNLRDQIESFEWQVNKGAFSECDLEASVALVSVAGNDYTHYMESGGSILGVLGFIDGVINQLKLDLKRLHDIGVRKVVVTSLHPVGCIPYITRGSNYTHCDDLLNLRAVTHNSKLKEAVENLGGIHSGFLSLDLYKAFESVINHEKGARNFTNTLKPCCEGKGKDLKCGEISEQGVEQYSLCRNPGDYFYWDWVHPTQAAWIAIFKLLKPSLRQFIR